MVTLMSCIYSSYSPSYHYRILSLTIVSYHYPIIILSLSQMGYVTLLHVAGLMRVCCWVGEKKIRNSTRAVSHIP